MPLYKLVDYSKLTLIPKVHWPQTHLDILFGKIRDIFFVSSIMSISFLVPPISPHFTQLRQHMVSGKKPGGSRMEGQKPF